MALTSALPSCPVSLSSDTIQYLQRTRIGTRLLPSNKIYNVYKFNYIIVCAGRGWRCQGHLHTSIIRVQRGGVKLPHAHSSEDGGAQRGHSRLPMVSAGLSGDRPCVRRPCVLPAPRSDREPEWMHCQPHPRGLRSPLQACGWLSFRGGSCVGPDHTTCSCAVVGEEMRHAGPPPKVCYLVLPKSSQCRREAVRERKWAQRAYEVTNCAWNPGLLGSIRAHARGLLSR